MPITSVREHLIEVLEPAEFIALGNALQKVRVRLPTATGERPPLRGASPRPGGYARHPLAGPCLRGPLRARRVVPGGVNSPVRAFRSVGGTP